MKQNNFAIIAGLSFALNSIIKGAFNSHHKTRLIKADDGKTGQVTAEGAKFFSNRKRLSTEEMAKRLPEGYKMVQLPEGFKWAINAQGAYVQAGQGELGQSLFAHALSDLTQGAAKAKTTAKPKPKTTAKPKAQIKAKA